MKAYKVTLLVIDFDEIGEESIKDEIENARYGNRCISPSVMESAGVDIGEFDDDHPLNTAGRELEFKRLFDDRHDRGGGEE